MDYAITSNNILLATAQQLYPSEYSGTWELGTPKGLSKLS